MTGAWLKITWAYLVELAGAGLLYLLCILLFGMGPLSSFVHKTSATWANLTGVLFAASLTIWVAFVNLTATDFGRYLAHIKMYFVYSTAFIVALFSFFLATVLLIVSSGLDNVLLANVSFAFLLYAITNVVTMVRNATGLVTAYAKFRDVLRKETEAKKQAENDGGTH